MIYVFQSTDAGAPVLAGQSGTLVELLDACLVNGYGLVSVAGITRSGSTVTVETTGVHGFSDISAVQIDGANQAEYNGKWRVATVPDSTHFTFDIGAAEPASPATGTMTVKRAPIGWTKAFSDTNKAAYRMPIGSNQHYLDVDDDNVGSQQAAGVRGYRAMSAIGTGSDQFPTSSQKSTYVVKKSNSTDATARPWIVVADEFCFYLGIEWHSISTYQGHNDLYMFGQGQAYNAADTGLTLLRGSQSSTPSYPGQLPGLTRSPSASYAPYAASDYAALTKSAQVMLDSVCTTILYGTGTTYEAPSEITGDNFIAPVYIVEESVSGRPLRGVLPGFYPAIYKQDVLTGTIKSDFIEYPGRRFIAVKVGFSSTYAMQLFDIDGPWR